MSTQKSPFETIAAGADLVLVAILIGVAAFLFIAPVRLLRGQTTGWHQHIAATAALAVWALAASTLAAAL